MSSETSLRDEITETIANWCAENGGGFPTAFVIALDHVNEEGENVLLISQMDEQTTQRSLGLAAYLDTWYRDDAIQHWRSLWGGEQ